MDGIWVALKTSSCRAFLPAGGCLVSKKKCKTKMGFKVVLKKMISSRAFDLWFWSLFKFFFLINIDILVSGG